MSDTETLDIKSEVAAAIRAALPDIVAAAKAAVVASGVPLVEEVAPPIIDAVDSLILAHTGATAPADATAAASDPASRLAAVEQHVAALTVATGNATSAQLSSAKKQIGAQQKAASVAAEAVSNAAK